MEVDAIGFTGMGLVILWCYVVRFLKVVILGDFAAFSCKKIKRRKRHNLNYSNSTKGISILLDLPTQE